MATINTVNRSETMAVTNVRTAVLRFVDWLDRYGELSHDHQSFFASDMGRAAKALYYRKPILGQARGSANDIL